MTINTYIEILVLIGVSITAYINIQRYRHEHKKTHLAQHDKPIVHVTYNGGFIDMHMLAKENPHIHFHTKQDDSFYS